MTTRNRTGNIGAQVDGELGRGHNTLLRRENYLAKQPLIWGDPIGVPVSRACSKGGATLRKQLGADRKSAEAIVATFEYQSKREGPNITCKEPATDDLEAST